MNFNLKKTGVYQAIRWGRTPLFKYRRFFKFLFLGLALVFTGLGALTSTKNFLGGGVLLFCFGVFFWEIDLFYNLKLKKPKLKYSLLQALQSPESINLASFLDYDSAKICLKAIRFCEKRAVLTLLKDALLYFLIRAGTEEVKFIFSRGEINSQNLRENLEKELRGVKEKSEIGFEKIIFEAARIAAEQKKQRISQGDILISFALQDPVFQKFLIDSDFRKEDIENLVAWYQRLQKGEAQFKCWWSYENLLKRGSIGKDWVAGYTLTLDKYSLDLRDKIRKSVFREIVGHKKEIKQIERVLEKEEINNILLVGEPGTGRGSIIEAIAQRAFLGLSSLKINYKRFLNLDLTALTSQTTSQEEAEALLEKCLREATEAGNIILVIDDFHNFISQAPILSRYLSSANFQIIAVTDYQGLHNIIERNPPLLNLFEKVEVAEISAEETLILLENYVPFFEKKQKRFVSYRALREILKLSSRYLAQIPFPERAIRLLDEAMAYLVTYTKERVLRDEHIKKVVSEKTEIPLEAVEEKEKEVLLRLEELIHQRIINQEEAVKEVSSALKRARAGVSLGKGPIGSFLFLGPTGVGKTETSKALSAIYFGSEKRMIRLDMSEFQGIDDIKRLIGSEAGEGLLTTPVRENPFSLLLLDELEKAHPNILNLFLQVLDEGWLTDGLGRKVDFQNTIIIATSNAGAEIIWQDIRADKTMDMVKEDLLDYLLKKGTFRPEFINRFDAVVVFKPLTKENLLKIASLMLKDLAKNLLDKGIKFEITKELKEKIVELSYEPAFGAREMKRVIQDKVENVLANAILSGKLKRGNRVKVGPNFNLIITKLT